MVAIVPASNQFDRFDRTHWRPRLRAGYLYLEDRRYYLYANKRAIYVRDALQLRFELAGIPKLDTIEVLIEGVVWNRWWVEGRTLVVSLEGLEGWAAYNAGADYDFDQLDFFKSSAEALDDNMIHVEYDYYQWNPVSATGSPTGKSFILQSISQDFRIGDAEKEYRLPDDWIRWAPVVITDNREATDERDHQLQFRIVEPHRTLEFNRVHNELRNPHFEMGYVGDPALAAYWYHTGSGVQRVDTTGYIGRNVLQIQGTGMAVQEVLFSGQPAAVEVWARAIGASGLARLDTAFKTPASGQPIVDQSGNIIGWDPDFSAYSWREEQVVGSGWTRLNAVFGEGSDCDVFDALYPDICDRMEVRLSAPSGLVQFGATALRRDTRVREYNWVPPTGTIEYETDPSGFFQPHPTGAYPYEYNWDVDANPVNVDAYSGFLAIVEVDEPTDEQLGLGELTWDDPHTYGVDYPKDVVPAWPTGIRNEFGRRHLPYAKVKGYQKLRQTQIFDLENQPPSLMHVTEPSRSQQPKNLLVTSPANAYRNVDTFPHMILHKTGGQQEYLTAILMDFIGNPIDGEWVSVLPSGQIQVDHSGAYTSHGGRVSVRTWPDAAAPPGTGQARIQFVHRLTGVSGTMRIDISS